MLFLVFFITAFTAVITQDLLGVSYYFDSSYTNSFSERKCSNTTRWELVSYDYLDVIPPYQLSSKAIKASANSCTSSFPIVLLNGTLELTVNVRTISKYSGITVVVFDKEDNAMEAVRYQRPNKNYMTGWTVISLSIKKHTVGFIQISGQSLSSELIIIDSLRYIPDNSTIYYDAGYVEAQKKTGSAAPAPAPESTSEAGHAMLIEPLELEFFEVEGSGGNEEDEDDIDGSGGWETGPPETEEPGTEEPGTEEPGTEEPGTEEPGTEEPGTEEPGTEGPGTEEPGTEEPGTEEPGTEGPGTEEPGTEDPGNVEPGTEEPGTEEPGTAEPGTDKPGTEDPDVSTDDPDTEEVIDESSDDPGFWNAFTITLVSVGAFVVVGSIGVGSYYLGKNRGISETPPLDIDALETPSVITVPRVRSIFSDAPSERFSRFS
ncbi:hypothetical protein MSG28_012373 [Choristoneura fumiferana]|uniref:Uncharacterized protein n=1 Tax=Choristoneura fumiferana TaxID=7141 RepID=A0ACC0KCU0_CHOFU|nr:hypothetical protein MSG28_012373 [Choristoneura fumiferana]